MSQDYHIAGTDEKLSSDEMAALLAREGQFLLPMVQLIEQAGVSKSSVSREAIYDVYGSHNPVQRCRNHKHRNVISHLPKDQHDQARATLSAAWKLDPEEGIRKIEQYAQWLERDWPSAASSLREGLAETFTVKRLGLPATLCRCLHSTNLIDSSQSGVRQKMRRVTNWQHGQMALRWAASAFAATEKNLRKIMGHEQLWMLKAHPDKPAEQEHVAPARRVG